jgi:branched-chain amino acid transport system substrate-binding protein
MNSNAWHAVVVAAVISMTSIFAVNVSADNETPLKIGALGDYSSVYSSVGGDALLEAVKMAVEDAGGKALGKPIEVVSGDSQLKPDVAAVLARRWFDRENVDALVDIPSTNVAYAVIPLANERKKVVLATSPASSSLSGEMCSPYLADWNYDTIR